MPETSIIMTSYNYAHYIGEAIESVLAQTYTDWELIIVDDGSKDNSIEIIESYINKNSEKIKLFTHPKHANLGIKATNELAFTKVRGEFTAFLESDDKWHPECLEKKIASLKKYHDVSLVYSDLELIGDVQKENRRYEDYVKYCRFVGKKIKKKPKNIIATLLKRNPIISFSNIIIKSFILKDFNILKEHEIWSDWQLVIHSSINGFFLYIDDRLLFWRIHKKSTNSTYMKSDFKNKNIDFKKQIKLMVKNSDNSLNKFVGGLSVIAKLRSLNFDLQFSLLHPNILISELLR